MPEEPLLGEWWLPGSDRKIPGVLIVDEDSVRLELMERLRPWEEDVEWTEPADGSKSGIMPSLPVYPRVLGLAGPNEYTLEDCFVVRSSIGAKGHNRQVLTVGEYWRGVWFEPEEEARASAVVFSFDDLLIWIGQSGIYIDPESYNNGAYSASLHKLPSHEISLDDELTLVLYHGRELSPKIPGEVVIRENWQVRVASTRELPTAEIIDRAQAFQHLLTIASGRNAAFASVELEHPAIFQQSLAGATPFPERLPYWRPWRVRPDDHAPPRHDGDLYFRFQDLGDVAFISRWDRLVQQYGGEVGRVMATVYSNGQYLEDKITNRAAALESWDEKLSGAKNSGLKTRLVRTAGRIAPHFTNLIGDVDSWAESIVDVRNDISHHRPPVDSPNFDLLLAQANSLYWLLTLDFLREAEAPSALLARVSAHRRIQDLRDAGAANIWEGTGESNSG